MGLAYNGREVLGKASCWFHNHYAVVQRCGVNAFMALQALKKERHYDAQTELVMELVLVWVSVFIAITTRVCTGIGHGILVVLVFGIGTGVGLEWYWYWH